jgi:uncharacterized protein YyaL (SSP411 family)
MKPNRLINANSPYLRQHAYNPVNWYPWCEEAFEEAKRLDKPIFLSIGYSTCHWCHVMACESFEDEEVANLLNEVCISIKVDREERPDIDNFYMRVCYALTGSGGWPLTIIMTPDKKPFYAGTYLPKNSVPNRIGLIELLNRVKMIWHQRRSFINLATEDALTALYRVTEPYKEPFDKFAPSILEDTYKELCDNFDNENGGFSLAPKFPTTNYLNFLLRYWNKTKEIKAMEMVEKTLKNMRAGGIYDQVGFGFHRYSIDAKWGLPHFEKMLYDQALLLDIYVDAFLATGKNIYKIVAEEIFEYVSRDMVSPEGAFYSAEDSESEGIEGKYYIWDESEIRSILNENEMKIAQKIFNIKDSNINILSLNRDFIEALEADCIDDTLYNQYDLIRKKLYTVRIKRIAPFKDKKILTDWNALMIASLVKAYKAFGNYKYLECALYALNYILANLISHDDKLLHVKYQNGESIPGKVDDYAFLINALIEMYQATFEANYIGLAIKLFQHLQEHFWDSESAGYFYTADYESDLILRLKEYFDGIIPSANSIMSMNLLKLARITGDNVYEKLFYNIIDYLPAYIARSKTAITQLINALDYANNNSFELIIFYNEAESELVKSILKKLWSKYLPNLILIMVKEPEEQEIIDIAPYLKNYKRINDKVSFYLCRNWSCELPTNEIHKIYAYLNI